MQELLGTDSKMSSMSTRFFSTINCVVLLVLLTGMMMLPLAAGAQKEAFQHKTDSANRTPAAGSYIVKYYVEEAAPGSAYETGPLHIIYSDGLDVVQKLPPKKESTEREIVQNQEGISDPQLAEDKKTMGWTETFDNVGTSYAVPLVLVLYRSGQIIRSIQQGQMVWSWAFVDGGKKVAVVWGLTHGPEVGDFQLYDVNTGRMLSEVFGDPDIQGLKPNAPQWAKKLEEQLNGGHKRK
jgi:hypothetical protein